MFKHRTYTVEDFTSRERAARVLLEVLNPLKPFYSESCARLDIGITSAHYEDDTVPMEAFARPLWGLVPFWAGGGSDPAFEEIYRKGLAAGPDPKNPAYWHSCRDYDQKFCEMAVIAYGMLFAPEKLWDPLSKPEKDNLIEWLREINRHECCACNWQFFKILTNLAIHKAGYPYDAQDMQDGLDLIESYYDQGGWYRDGNGGDKDYYNPFVMVPYGLLYAKFMDAEDPDRCRRFRERALAFGKDFLYWFDDEGRAVPYGRSMTYRFAQVAYFSICVLTGLEPLPLPVMKGIIARHLTQWLNSPIFDNAGVLSIGYGYPNLQMSESYNAPGSPYWAMKAFAFLGLPAEHPFWRAEAAPLPPLARNHFLPHANMLVQHGAGNAVMLVPGRTKADGHSHTVEKYGKFAYSSKFGFSIARSPYTLGESAPDSMLAFAVNGLFYVKDTIAEDYSIGADGLCFSWSPVQGIRVHTRIQPTENGHLRTHEVESDFPCVAYDCGFALHVSDYIKNASRAAGSSATVESCEDFCTVQGLDGGAGQVLRPDPNTNLNATKTAIPMVVYQITPGRQRLRTQLSYLR